MKRIVIKLAIEVFENGSCTLETESGTKIALSYWYDAADEIKRVLEKHAKGSGKDGDE